MDEPTSALDPIGRKEVRELIARLRDQGKTIFLNSHLLSEMESVCNYVGIIHRSELVVHGEWRKLSSVAPQIELTVEAASFAASEELPAFVTDKRLHRQDADRSTWLLTLDRDNRVPELLQALIARGVAVHEVVQKQQSLEEVFLYWVQKKEGKRMWPIMKITYREMLSKRIFTITMMMSLAFLLLFGVATWFAARELGRELGGSATDVLMQKTFLHPTARHGLVLRLLHYRAARDFKQRRQHCV